MAVTAKPVGKSSQDFVPIKQIRDGVAVLKNGEMRMALLVSSINFALKSAEEQTAILLQFQNFLNALDFHIQIFVQSRRLDIRPYIATLEERLVAQTNDLLKVQTREYIQFIKKFTETTEIMTKSFFVLVPYSQPVLQKSNSTSFLGKIIPTRNKSGQINNRGEDNFDEYRNQLEQRVGVIEQGLASVGLRSTVLGTEELVELYFKIFNPGESDMPSLS